MKAVKLTTFTILMVSIAGLLFVVAANPLFSFEPFESATVNSHINYQLSALPVAALAAVVTFLFAGRTILRYLNFNREGVMRPFFSKKGEDGRWETDGRAIGLIMVAIIGVVTFFQLLPGGFSFHWVHLLFVIPLAATNAVVEETIYRLSFVSVGARDSDCLVRHHHAVSGVRRYALLGCDAKRIGRGTLVSLSGLLPGQIHPGNQRHLLGVHDSLPAGRGDPRLPSQRRMTARSLANCTTSRANGGGERDHLTRPAVAARLPC
ncbi:hypothetical protein [Citricoccus sp. NR2]|uniref:hypothetical protein n=1 Tax=Citricoccus sp. NR2 TaxID=3004095 RepID=UPI0022DE4B8B|nr:hypothetical protein [Citricoccus sp. NR2]WBL18785.1 hypothetical protein O1A05_13665 [Citricoccus sp. NR2]